MRATPVWLLILFFSLPIFAQNVNFNKGKAAKKALEDAASSVEKEANKYLEEFKKAK